MFPLSFRSTLTVTQKMRHMQASRRHTWLSMQQSTGYAAYNSDDNSDDEDVEILRAIDQLKRSAKAQESKTASKTSAQKQEPKAVVQEAKGDADARNRTDLRRIVSCGVGG